jgi:hypothetical protein
VGLAPTGKRRLFTAHTLTERRRCVAPGEKGHQAGQSFAVGKIFTLFLSRPRQLYPVAATAGRNRRGNTIPLFGSTFTAPLTAAPRFKVTFNGVAGSILKN